MENIIIIPQHIEEWDENRNYISSEVYGLLILNDCTYNNLVAAIYNELKLEPGLVGIKIEYQARGGYSPLFLFDESEEFIKILKHSRNKPSNCQLQSDCETKNELNK